MHAESEDVDVIVDAKHKLLARFISWTIHIINMARKHKSRKPKRSKSKRKRQRRGRKGGSSKTGIPPRTARMIMSMYPTGFGA